MNKRTRTRATRKFGGLFSRPKPLGIKLYANGFRSEKAAKLAGEKALRELLDTIAREQSKGT